MLIGIPTCIGPDLLALLHRMGHGDELVLADAFFCGETFGRRVVRADGIRIPELLDGILGLINLDDKVPDPLVMMEPSPGGPAGSRGGGQFPRRGGPPLAGGAGGGPDGAVRLLRAGQAGVRRGHDG